MGKYFREIQVPRFQRFPDSRGPDSRGFTVVMFPRINEDLNSELPVYLRVIHCKIPHIQGVKKLMPSYLNYCRTCRLPFFNRMVPGTYVQ